MARKSLVSKVVNQGNLTFSSSPGVEAGATALRTAPSSFDRAEVA